MGIFFKCFILTVVSLGRVAQSAPTVVALQEARPKLKLSEYSLAEKELLLDQATLVLRDLYVNRELKIEAFGEGVDPLPRLQAIRRQVKELSAEQFHLRLSEVFRDLHDLHTTYTAPTPLKCALAFVPLRFESVKNGQSQKILVSQKIKLKAELVEEVAIGDELLGIDEESVEEALAALARFSGGANRDAIRARSVQLLSLRSSSNQPLPSNDEVKLELSGPNGKYSKTIPWQALLDEECLKGVEDRRSITERMHLGEDDYQKKFNKVFPLDAFPARWATLRGEDSALAEVFETALLHTPAGSLGYVRLKSFYWTSRGLDVQTVIDGMRRAIDSQFANARGIVIDVRGNPGGLLPLSEKLVQLFSKRSVEPVTMRMLANKLNEEIFLRANGRENRWSASVRSAIAAGVPYAGPLSVTPLFEANEMGQIWFRPVVVLTDASCYSACDVFAAGMKDSGAGTIIGLHEATGGGGANVMEHSTFRAILAQSENNPFKALPRGQSMRVSWRQVIRAGKASGKLIENLGVESDVVVPLTTKDVGTESKDLMRSLHRIIDKLEPEYRAEVGPRAGSLVLLENGKEANWKERVKGADLIEAYAQGKKVGTFPIEESDELAEVEIGSLGLKGEWRDLPIVLMGRSQGNEVFRIVRELKWRGEYTEIGEEGTHVDFEEGLGPVRAAVLHGPANAGWQAAEGVLRVGAGPKYPNSAHARAFLPLRLRGEGGLFTFDLKLEAEDPYDSLRLFLVNLETGERRHLFAGSEVPETKGVKLKLPLDWENADLVFEFESDENWNLSGPVIDNFKIERL